MNTFYLKVDAEVHLPHQSEATTRIDNMVPEKKHKKSKSKDKEKKQQQNKKNYSNVSENEQEFNDEAETDDDAAINLDEELHSIGYYISDRKTMLDQVFSVTTESKIRAMLPPILKVILGRVSQRAPHGHQPSATIFLCGAGVPYGHQPQRVRQPLELSELKSLCLDQLLGMSSKRILSILNGQQLDSSSDTDDVEDGSDLEPKAQIVGEKNSSDRLADIDGFEMSGLDMDTLEIGITSKDIGDLFTDDAEVKVEKKKEKSWEKKSKHAAKKKHKKRSDKEKNKLEKESKCSEEEEEEAEPEEKSKPVQKEIAMEEDKGKSLLEILELEMRARAIRALLREHGDSPGRLGDSHERQGSVELLGEQEATVNIKQEPNELQKLKRNVTESASHSKHVKLKKMDSRSKRTRHLKKHSDVQVKAEVVDIYSDPSVDIKEITHVVHSDLETVSSGEDVFIDMKEKYAPREDGEVSSIDDSRLRDYDDDDDEVVEVKYNVTREVITVEDSDGDVREIPKQALSEICDQTDRVMSHDRRGEEHEESWAQRWLQSKGVQKVVTDSRMLARIHKRMKTAHKGRVSLERTKTVPSVDVVGSVDEYRSLKFRSARK